MTGTALTEEKEFREIYGMDVIEIPTNRAGCSVLTWRMLFIRHRRKNSVQYVMKSRRAHAKASAGTGWYDYH